MSHHVRYFLTYSGRSLPLQLAEELAPDALRNRNTWFEAHHDAQGRVVAIVKMVYGEVEMRHDYVYSEAGQLSSATIAMGDEAPMTVDFAV